jgi:hypothetical protein
MLAANEFRVVAPLDDARQASDYEATAAVIAMKNRPHAFASEADDDLICYLQRQPQWVIERLPAEWLFWHGEEKMPPRYENVVPLVAALLDSMKARRSGGRNDRRDALMALAMLTGRGMHTPEEKRAISLLIGLPHWLTAKIIERQTQTKQAGPIDDVIRTILADFEDEGILGASS